MVSDPPIRDAASVILLREGPNGCEVLMGQRGTNAAFMPDRFVFPGGAVEAADHSLPLCAPIPDDLDLQLQIAGACPPQALIAAAFRELQEETGLRLHRQAPQDLRFFFRAVTPLGRPRRFDARFFIARAADLAEDTAQFSDADGELSYLTWIGLDRAKTLDIPFITHVILAELAQAIAISGPDFIPERVGFFDNRGPVSRFCWL
ncbi:NUDIX hydrolase [Rhodobacteraceae bacterium XHP0102]|nr:NUDIX hydrolase [Rhodobacteraceae bacterium XHP0102]